jgi:chromosome segregation ATPase
MKKARPGELNQKIKRLQASRDGLKRHNHEKSLRNKALRDRTVEITENRDQWKTRSKELDRQLQAAKEEIESERMRADKERERADKLQAEIETVWGKKSRA